MRSVAGELLDKFELAERESSKERSEEQVGAENGVEEDVKTKEEKDLVRQERKAWFQAEKERKRIARKKLKRWEREMRGTTRKKERATTPNRL